jgi:hypothetical protein
LRNFRILDEFRQSEKPKMRIRVKVITNKSFALFSGVLRIREASAFSRLEVPTGTHFFSKVSAFFNLAKFQPTPP